MLYWSESDPECKADPQLVATLARQESDEEYEAKISGLLRRAFQADLTADPGAKDRWRHAAAVLNRGDHYISIMIDQAIGSKVRSWSRLWGLRAVPVALALFVVYFAYFLAVRTFLGHDPSRGEIGFVTWALAMTLAVVYGLLRAVLGGQVMDDFIAGIVDRIFGAPRA